MTRLHELRWTRFLAALVAWVLMLPVPLWLIPVYSGLRLDTVSFAVFLVVFALILLGFLLRRRWVWLILLVEWCCVPFAWTVLQTYYLLPKAAAKVTQTETVKWDFDPVDVYCNGTLVGRSPFEIDLHEFFKSIPPANPPSQETSDVRGKKCRSFVAIENWFGYVPREARQQYWLSFDCAGHSGLFCAPDGVRVESATGPMFLSIQAHADALVHALQHAGYKPDSAWVKHTAANLTPLFSFLNDTAYQDLRIKPALDQAVCMEFGIRESMSEDEVSACWADILDRVEEKRSFRIPSPEWYAINLLGDRLLPFLEGSYVEERSRRNTPSRFHNGVRPAFVSPEGVAVRFLPVFYAVGKLHPPALQDRITYDAGAFGTPFEVLRQAYLSGPYDRRRIAPLSSFYLDLPGFDNPRNDWRMASELPLIDPIQVATLSAASAQILMRMASKLHFTDRFEVAALTPASAQLLIQSVPSTPIDTLLRWGGNGGRMPLFERLRYLALMRAPSLVREFKIPAGCLAAPAKTGTEESQARFGRGRTEDPYIRMRRQALAAPPAASRDGNLMDLFAAVAAYPNPALDKPLLACLDEARTCQTLPPETRYLIQALIMCGTPDACEVLGRWWSDNTPVSATVDDNWRTIKETSPRALITDAIATLPRMAEPLAVWVQYLAALDDAQLMTRAVNALVCIHTPEAWAVLEKWSGSGPPEVADAAKRAIETERIETEKIASLIAGTLQPNELLSQ